MQITNTKIKGMMMAVAMSVGALSAQADLILTQSDGTTVSYAVSAVSKITFSGTTLQVVTASGSTAYSLSSLNKLSFGSTTGIGSAEAVASGVSVSVVAEQLQVSGAQGAKLAVYTVDGKQVLTDYVKESVATYSLGALSAGVYVVRVGSHSSKIVKP